MITICTRGITGINRILDLLDDTNNGERFSFNRFNQFNSHLYDTKKVCISDSWNVSYRATDAVMPINPICRLNYFNSTDSLSGCCCIS